MYRAMIVYDDDKINEVEIPASDYLEAMRLFHKICNMKISIEHKVIKQTLLVEE